MIRCILILLADGNTETIADLSGSLRNPGEQGRPSEAGLTPPNVFVNPHPE